MPLIVVHARVAGIRHWDDLQYTAVVQAEAEYAHVNVSFKVYEISGWNLPSDPRGRGYGNMSEFWILEDSNQIEQLQPVPVFLHGSVKWDGCSNWNFDKQDEVMLHFCDKKQASNVGVLFERLYDWAKELGMDRL